MLCLYLIFIFLPLSRFYFLLGVLYVSLFLLLPLSLSLSISLSLSFTFPQYSHVSLRPLLMISLRASGSKIASNRPFCASALIAEGSIGGICTPGGRGGKGMSFRDDRRPPRPLPRPEKKGKIKNCSTTMFGKLIF